VRLVDEDYIREIEDKEIVELLVQTELLPDNHPIARKITTIGRKILRSSDCPNLTKYNWQFIVIDGENLSCFASSSGKIVFFTGLLNICKNDDSIAVILGHEIGHMVARHHQERISSIRWWLQKKTDPKHSQTLESEADYIGLMLMARACYDPRAAVTLWQNFDLWVPDQNYPGYVSFRDVHSHPSHKTREENVKAWLPDAFQELESHCSIKHHGNLL